MGFFSTRPPEPESMSRQYLRSAPPAPRTDNLAISCLQHIAGLDIVDKPRFGELLTVGALAPASQSSEER